MSDVQDLADLGEEPLETSLAVVPADTTERNIERQFETGRLRVVQDRNDFFLPHVVDFIEGRRWGNLHPEYQRRLRWDDEKKSRLIESFIMNVPVPPVFLYEKGVGEFEVMDGQQRLSAIVDFIQGRFQLTGLTIWQALNKRTFGQLPPMVRRGLERAKISAITLMSDAGSEEGDNIDLRAQVFDRLNTGGERLNPQELRSALNPGPFARLLLELSQTPRFSTAWEIPDYAENTLADGGPSDVLKANNLFKRMLDVEIVLRFFAFLQPTQIVGAVRSILDRTMARLRNASPEQLDEMRQIFLSSLNIAIDVFGNRAFRLPEGNAAGQLSRPLWDAEMIALHRLGARAEEILARREQVATAVMALAQPNAPTYELIVGRANTANAIRGRIDAVETAIAGAL
jgi:hypothetical protein